MTSKRDTASGVGMKHGCNLALCKAEQVKFNIFDPNEIYSRSFLRAGACVKKFAWPATCFRQYPINEINSSIAWFPCDSTAFLLNLFRSINTKQTLKRTKLSSSWFVAELTDSCRRDGL